MTRRSAFLFIALGIAWGIPYALIKIAVGELQPSMLVLARTALAAAVLLPIAFARGDVLPTLKRWRPLLAYTVAELVLPWFFLSTAEQTLPSATTGLLLATVPLAGVGVSAILRRPEHLRVGGWVGIALGMAGVALLVGLDVGGTQLGAVLELAVVVIGYALGPAILAAWMPGAPALGIAATSLALAAIVYAPVVAVDRSWPSAWPSAPVIASVIVLALVCSAAAFIMMPLLVAEIGPVRATGITYVNPAVALATGALLLGEPITGSAVAGFALILLGCFLLTRSRRLAPIPAPAPPPA